MNGVLILLGICITALTPTIAIVVTRYLDKKERAEVAAKVAAVAVTADSTAASVDAFAGRVEEIAVTTEQKLNEIKTIVDGPLTRALRTSRAALSGQRIALAELADLREENGRAPTQATKEALAELDLQIAELDVTIAERGAQEARGVAHLSKPAKLPTTERQP